MFDRLSPHRRGLAYAALGILVISPDGALIKSLDHLPLWDVMLWRAAGLALALTAIFAAMGRAAEMTRAVRDAPLLYVGAALLHGGGVLLFVHGVRSTSVAHAVVIIATIPFWAALIGRITIGEAVALRTIAAMILGAIGVSVLAVGAEQGGEATLLGDALCLAAAAGIGSALVCSRRAGAVGLGPALIIGGGVSALVCAALATFPPLTATDIALIFGMSAVMAPLAWLLLIKGAQTAPAAEVGLLSIVETILGPLWAWAALGPAPSTIAIIGGAIVLSGVVLNAVLSPKT